jgi:hypothetical protein
MRPGPCAAACCAASLSRRTGTNTNREVAAAACVRQRMNTMRGRLAVRGAWAASSSLPCVFGPKFLVGQIMTSSIKLT